MSRVSSWDSVYNGPICGALIAHGMASYGELKRDINIKEAIELYSILYDKMVREDEAHYLADIESKRKGRG